ncbi:hypothetical protein P8A21_29140 [Streptomyces poriferorum]|uniref:hypothetical protein n=1 Tax=Streptomyces poriferorum TaxID=2798799 RepID=UPI00273D028B|nr:hypothetical protein [Streptomyces sp. Alt1]WLQ51298.1 hypothetical protein P8A21_29140 [Streptomyces sp. Alt1]
MSLTSERNALVVVFVGIALALSGAGLASLLDEPSWRWLATGGVLVQTVGWIRYSRVRRGGAA